MTVFAVGIELDGEGTHPAAWRRSSHRPDQLLTGKAVRDRVAAAENAGFTFATVRRFHPPPEWRRRRPHRCRLEGVVRGGDNQHDRAGPRRRDHVRRTVSYVLAIGDVGLLLAWAWRAGLLFRSKTMPRRGRGGGLR